MKETIMKDKKKAMIIIGIILILIIGIIGLVLMSRKTEYTVSFETNGGTLIETITVGKNETVSKPENPVKENYEFAGWYYNGKVFDFSTRITNNMKLEARWYEIENVAKIELDKTEVVLNPGETSKITVTSVPEEIKNEDIIWESSNPDIVSVDEDGNLTAIKAGTATITVKNSDGKYVTIVKITVNNEDENVIIGEIKVNGVVLNKSSLTLEKGETAKLIATVKPSTATNKNVIWSSNNTNVVSVDSKGNVKAIGVGNAKITVKTKDGGYSATANITVIEKSPDISNDEDEKEEVTNQTVSVTGVTIDKTTLNLTEGNTAKLTATVNPSNASNKEVVWVSNNSSVVSVDTNGNITALAAGNATITVTTKDGNFSASCQVTVTEKAPTYSVIFTKISQEVTGANRQYSITVKKNGAIIEDYRYIIYNGRIMYSSTFPEKRQIDESIEYAEIYFEGVAEPVTATVIYN